MTFNRVRGWLFKTNSDHVIAVATVIAALAAVFYTYSANRQLKVMRDQLDQMKGGSSQTDKLISETHTLADNAGKQATNTAEQVQKLGAMADAATKQALAVGGQLSVMQKQLESAERPWIAIDVTPTELTYNNSGVRIGIRYTFKNVGKSPAQNIWRSAKLIGAVLLMGVPKGSPEPKEVQRQLCESVAAAKRTSSIPGYTVFPGDHFADQEDLTLSMQEINAFFNNNWAQMPIPRPLPLGIVGCVDYTFESSPRHHQTGFAFEVLGGQGGAPLITEVPMHQSVGLARVPIGGFYFAN